MNEDCFAYRKTSNNKFYCMALKEIICEQRICPFYKTFEEYVKGYEGYPEYKKICQTYGVEPKR